MKKTSTNYDYFVKMDTTHFKGEWVAIADKKVVSHGKDAEKVYKQAKQKTTSEISLAKIPKEQLLVLKFSA